MPMEISFETLGLTESPLGDLLLPPSQRDNQYGGPRSSRKPVSSRDATISIKEIEIHIGNRPICWRLRDLYKKAHKDLPPDLEVFEEYDIWMVAHAIGAIKRGGWGSIQSLGYQADYDEDLVYTIDLLPARQFISNLDGEVKASADLGIEGRASIPEPLRAVLQASETLGGDARIKFSAEAKLVGRLSFSVLTPVIQVTGLYHSRCEWKFDEEKEPLLGDQMMFQTVLVPAGVRSVKTRVRGYALVQTSWLPFPAKFQTKQLELEIRP